MVLEARGRTEGGERYFFPGRDSRSRRGRLWTLRGGGLFSAEEEEGRYFEGGSLELERGE